MIYRQLGRHGLPLSVFGLGIWQTFGQTIDDATARAVLEECLKHGINHIDGAEAYGRPRGNAERVVGYLLREMRVPRDCVVLSGKCSRAKHEEPTRRGMHRKHLIDVCEQTLRRYQTDYLDLYYIHRHDGVTSNEEVVRTMNHLIQQGKILHWGGSEFPAEAILDMHWIAGELGLEGPAMDQSHYNILARDRVEKELAPVVEQTGIGIIAYCPLQCGVLTGKYHQGIPEDSRYGTFASNCRDESFERQVEQARALQSAAGELGVSLIELSLAALIHNGQVSSALLGISKPHYVAQNLKALDLLPKLSGEILDQIKGITQA